MTYKQVDYFKDFAIVRVEALRHHIKEGKGSMSNPQVLIIEFGSQHTLQIQRRLRNLGFSSIVMPPRDAEEYLSSQRPSAVIGSGGMRSVYEPDAPRLPPTLIHSLQKSPIPYLGICYGMQAMAHALGLSVKPGKPEYARTIITTETSRLFQNLSPEQQVWMSHGDAVSGRGSYAEFSVIAVSKDGIPAALSHANGSWFGVQFHPEVDHTPGGVEMLRNFLNVAEAISDYTPQSLPTIITERIVEAVGNERAIVLYSGGVDSSVIATLAARALGEQVLAITIDGGHMRENEIEEVKRNASYTGVTLKVVEGADEFIAAIGQTTDPEEKRAAFRKVYAEIARREAAQFGATVILQGTIAPDRIESAMTGAAKIKTHHNSAGLDFGNLRELHPIAELFKDEVRVLAQELGLPLEIFNRPPFPGPGNFIRVVNMRVTREILEVVAWAEARVREHIQADPRYRDVSQLVVGVTGKRVGVKGDKRVYGYVVTVRAVRTQDFMTAQGVAFEPDFQKLLEKTLTTHPLVTGVSFETTDKPPATVEFE